MEEKVLFKAAREGNISWLQSLLAENPMLLERVMPLFTETPLHVAAAAGKTEFVKHLLSYAPRLAKQPSSRNGLNAMHIAVANGHADVVSVLLDFDHELSVLGDSEGSVSLHYAAYHGRVDIAKLLVSRKPATLVQVNYKGENALHVAFKMKQNEVMTVLGEMLQTLGVELTNQVITQAKDENGNTVEQLIRASKSQVPGVVCETYTLNTSQSDESDDEVAYSHESPEAMMVIGILIATVTFQGLMSPPQSLLKDGIAYENSSGFTTFFLAVNSIAFLASCFSICCSVWGYVNKLAYWVGVSLGATIISYIFVLFSMLENRVVVYQVLGLTTALGLPFLIAYLYNFSHPVRKFLKKIKSFVKS